MIVSRPNRARSPGRAAPRRASTWLSLVALALGAFGFSGCASLGTPLGTSDSCGGCGLTKCSGLFNNCRFPKLQLPSMFHRRTPVAESYSPGVQEYPVDSMPGGLPSALPPADIEPEIKPAPGMGATGGATKATNLGFRSTPDKAYYQADASRPIGGPRGARRTPDRSRMGSSDSTLGATLTAATGDDPLANLPEPNGPSESPETSPPRAPTAGAPPSGNGPKLTPTPASASTELPPKPAEASAMASLAPGIRRFKVLEPNLAAGSLPTEEGWRWLVDRGYKTVLDLREPTEIRPEELAAIDHQGLRHVSLPTSTSKIDPSRVKRFAAEIGQESARPIFVFDADGSRPATLFFVQQVSLAKKERRTAERDVEELGAFDSALWRAAGDYLGTLTQSTALPVPVASAASSTPAPAVVPLPDTLPHPTAPTPKADPDPTPTLANVIGPVEEGEKLEVNMAALIPVSVETPVPVEPNRKLGAWKPYAALALASLGVPLAYIGRSAINWGTRSLASLPAPANRPKSLPSELGG